MARKHDYLDKAIDNMIARRVKAGYSEEGAGLLLRELLDSHSGDNLAHALFYEGFATPAAARVFAFRILNPDN